MLYDFRLTADGQARFDVVELRRRLDEIGAFVIQLPSSTHAVGNPQIPPEFFALVCEDAAQATRLSSWIEAGNTADDFIGSVALLAVDSEWIYVYQAAPQRVIEHVAQVLVPIVTSTPFRVDSEGTDYTAMYAERPEGLFGLNASS